LGNDIGEFVWQVGSVLTGVEATAKAGVSLARLGVTVSTTTLKAMSKTDLAVGVRAQVAVAGRTSVQAGKDLATRTAETLRNTVKRPAKAGAIVDNAGSAGAIKSAETVVPNGAVDLSQDFIRARVESNLVESTDRTIFIKL
jgi:hypothetical protein